MRHQHQLLHCFVLLTACVLAAPALHAQGSAIDEATEEQRKSATAVYEQGLQAMEAEKYSDALVLFRQSYATVNSPNSQLMIGRALVKLGRLTEAYSELRHALQKATELATTQKKYEKTVSSTQSELGELSGRLAYVMVPAGTTARIQGRAVGPFGEDESVPVSPGTVSIEVTYADGETQTKEVTLGAGEKANLPPQTRNGSVGAGAGSERGNSAGSDAGPAGELGMSRKTLGFIVGGVGLVGLGTFVGATVIGAPAIFGDPKDDCSATKCSEADMDNQARKSMLQGIGYAGLGVGIAGLGIGTWLVLGGSTRSAPSTALGIGPGTVQLNHRF